MWSLSYLKSRILTGKLWRITTCNRGVYKFIYEQNEKEYFKIVKVIKIESQELLLFTQTGKI